MCWQWNTISLNGHWSWVFTRCNFLIFRKKSQKIINFSKKAIRILIFLHRFCFLNLRKWRVFCIVCRNFHGFERDSNWEWVYVQIKTLSDNSMYLSIVLLIWFQCLFYLLKWTPSIQLETVTVTKVYNYTMNNSNYNNCHGTRKDREIVPINRANNGEKLSTKINEKKWNQKSYSRTSVLLLFSSQ